jgi:hypothetical protein
MDSAIFVRIRKKVLIALGDKSLENLAGGKPKRVNCLSRKKEFEQ